MNWLTLKPRTTHPLPSRVFWCQHSAAGAMHARLSARPLRPCASCAQQWCRSRPWNSAPSFASLDQGVRALNEGFQGFSQGTQGGDEQGSSGRCALRHRRNVDRSVVSQDATWGGSVDQKEGSVALQDAGYIIGCVSGSRAGGPPEVPWLGTEGGGVTDPEPAMVRRFCLQTLYCLLYIH